MYILILCKKITVWIRDEDAVINYLMFTNNIENIKDKLDNFDDLSADELDDICLVLKTLKSSKEEV